MIHNKIMPLDRNVELKEVYATETLFASAGV